MDEIQANSQVQTGIYFHCLHLSKSLLVVAGWQGALGRHRVLLNRSLVPLKLHAYFNVLMGGCGVRK